MTNQEILQALAGIECALYYRKDGSDDLQNVSQADTEKAHAATRDMLEFWHKVTGETLND
jgi:hypothetical protein